MLRDWKTYQLGDILTRVSKPVDVRDNETYTEIGIRSHGKGIFYKDAVLGKDLGEKAVFWVQQDCLILNIVFAWEQAVARTTIREEGKIASHRFPMYRPDCDIADLDYLTYFFKSTRGKHLLTLASPGGAGRNKTLGKNEFDNIALQLPPLPEQKQIASCLSLWDHAIELTRQQIAVRQLRQKGLVQQLLTGKQRFPQFSGEWQKVLIGDVLREVKRPVKWDDLHKYRLISVRRRSGGLFSRGDLHGNEIKTKKMNLAKAGDFLISKMQVVHGALGLVTQEFDGMHFSDSYISLRAREPEKFDIRFFDWLSKTPWMYHQAYLSSWGVHIEKMTFNLRDFLKREIQIPTSRDEQEYIIKFLDLVSEEIKCLESELGALAAQKKGLMQQLLTGKRRVNVSAAA